MLLDVVSFHSSQRRMGATAREALPDAPVVPEERRAAPRPSGLTALRRRSSLLLRRLADRIDPVPARGAGTVVPSG